jgi:type VI secretion system FHA domain protein
LFAAAGIDGLNPSREAAHTLGEVLHIAVGGVMEVLRARERMKEELRMRATAVKAAHNNPLKFSANVDDAFHNLLVKRNPAYLEPADAFDDAFRDVSDHHAAMLTAMRLAFEAMLAHFDPDRLQEDFDRQMKKGSILGVPAKLRYWDLYRDKYGQQTKDAESAFRTLFADEFARAYEEQIERLRAQGRGREK